MSHPDNVLGPAPDWQADAACASSATPNDFFPKKGNGTARNAKDVCAGCDVRAKCLQWALDNNIQYGVWGGATFDERRRMRRARRNAA